MELDNFGNLDEALVCFKRACELNPRFGVAWFFAGLTHMRRGEHREAFRCLRKAEQCGHATPVGRGNDGRHALQPREFAASAQAYRQALQRSPESPLLESKLGLALGRTGATEEGLRKMRSAVQQRPDLADLHDRLILYSYGWSACRKRPSRRKTNCERCRDLLQATSDRAASLWAKAGRLGAGHCDAACRAAAPRWRSPLNQALAELASREGAGVDQLVTTLQEVRTGRTRTKVSNWECRRSE